MAEKLIRVFEDAVTAGHCKECRAALEFYPTLNGHVMPMNAGSVPRKSIRDEASGRVIVFMSSDESHFATCPQAEAFRRRR